MQIGVLTYIGRHRKTYDTLCLLKARGYHNVKVYAVPYQYTKTFCPLYEHRPCVNDNFPETEDICRSFGYEFIGGGV